MMVTDNLQKGSTQTISLTDRQLWMVRSALEEYLATFSHHEGDIVSEIKAVLRSLPTVEHAAPRANPISPRRDLVTL
jgi:hypothetical protein